MALGRVGIEAVIYEAHPGNADYVGSFLNLASNGLGALRAIDAHAIAAAEGFPTPHMTMWSGTGKRLGDVPNGMTLADGMVSTTILRGALHRVLREEALRRGIRIEHGKRLVSAETTSSGVIARFEDGTEAYGDLLVGVDGVHSRVRALVDPSAPPPRYTGQLSLGGIARGTRVAPTPGAYHMVFGHRAFFGYSVTPSGDGYWFANVATAEEPARDELAQISSVEWKERLVSLFENDAGPALELVRGTTDELGAYPIHDLPTVPVWHRGALVIAGDAAHATSPSSGQGASMAIEDAIVLARCVRDARDDGGLALDAAFTSYEAARRPRVERVVAYSARVGSSKVPGPMGRLFRDLFMPTALRMLATSTANEWLYRHTLPGLDDSRAP